MGGRSSFGDVTLVTFNVQNVWSRGKDAGSRGEKSARMLLESGADLICLQEYDNAYRISQKNLNTLLSEQFAEVPIAGIDAGSVWNPIFYKTDLFEVTESGMTDLFADGIPCYENLKYPSGNGRSHFRTMVWANLCRKSDGARFSVANLHYSVIGKEKNGIFSQDGEVDHLLPVMKKCADATGLLLVCGDYNAGIEKEGGACRRMLAAGFSDTRDLACEKNDIRTWTNESVGWLFDGSYRSAIDHVFTNDKKLCVRSYLAMPAWANIDGEQISDHCPTVVCFTPAHFLV